MAHLNDSNKNGYSHKNGSAHSSSQILRSKSTGDLGDNQIVRATEGWLELFLTPPEKLQFSKWNEVVRDKSLVHTFTRSLFIYLCNFIPLECAPNLVTLAGFVFLGQSWYLSHIYAEIFPTTCTWIATGGICFLFVANSLSGPLADRTRQHTALSDLFKYTCDNASTVLLAMLTTSCLGGDSLETQWYAVQAGQLILFLKHLSAFRRHAGLRYRLAAGPGEVLIFCGLLLTLRATVGLDYLCSVVDYILRIVFPKESYDHHLGGEAVRLFYYALFVLSIVQSLMLNSKRHGWTRFGLLISLSMRLVPAILLQAGVQNFPLTVTDVVCDGLFMSVLTSDIVLAKMASRELHPWVVVMSFAAVLSHGVILTLVAIYYIGVFSDLCFYLNLPLLTTCRNVYCDGVYDLCHIGHKRAFQNALTLGNRLLVGVIGDEDASAYKRPPIMTAAERCAEVEACKAVTKVIPNAPCFGLTQEFLDEHQIHVVAFGQEYLEKYPDPKDDPYYGYVRQLGMAHPLPRTHTLSTSDLISRIQSASLKKKSPT
jgi:cytidyltransferase-like protein